MPVITIRMSNEDTHRLLLPPRVLEIDEKMLNIEGCERVLGDMVKKECKILLKDIEDIRADALRKAEEERECVNSS